MPFRIKIISPIKIDEADLRRRRMRYGERANPDTYTIPSPNYDEAEWHATVWIAPRDATV